MEKYKIILDTDIKNEIDDQFALTYLLKSLDVFDLELITIAPFSKSGYAKDASISEGLEDSYNTTLKILKLLNIQFDKVYKGSDKYFNEQKEENEAVNKIIEVANKFEKTYILAIGAITNVALALQKDPSIKDKIEVIWLGGNSIFYQKNDEFNFRQDIIGVRYVFESEVKLTIIPCRNVASNLSTTIYELEHYLKDKNEISNFLCNQLRKCKKEEVGMSKTIWDISVIAYLINKDWFKTINTKCPKLDKEGTYLKDTYNHEITFVVDLLRNPIYKDFFTKVMNND